MKPKHPTKLTYPIDIRIFTLMIAISMTLSFLLGIISNNKFTASDGKIKHVERLEAVHSFDIGDEVSEAVSGVTSKNVGDMATNVEFNLNKTITSHRPSGQHLLIDLKNVSPLFLNNEEQLANATVTLIKHSDLTLLSYHCHSLQPAGVSCVGILLESHISFHTWPVEGVITLDLFTCGSKSLLPNVAIIQELFGIPNDNNDKIITDWSHELRGFRKQQERLNHVLDNTNDLANDLLSSLDAEKKLILSKNTQYHQVDIWDVKDQDDYPTYLDAIKHNLSPGDVLYTKNTISSPQRDLYINGKAQGGQREEKEFYEGFIHPALVIHDDPKNVVLLGSIGGSGLREVLKHDTVDNVVVIEQDKELLSIVKEYLPFLCDCSDIEESHDDCYQDERVWLYHHNAKDWFSLYSKEYHNLPMADNSLQNETEVLPEKLDVVFINPVDHFYARDLESKYFQDGIFLNTIYHSLNKNGILVVQIGLVPSIHDPNPNQGILMARETIIAYIENHPLTQAMFVYEEPHVGFEEPTAFLIACKSIQCRSKWYSSSYVVDYEVNQRLRGSNSGIYPLAHYDGSTQYNYQFPSRGWEIVYCKRIPKPKECDYVGLDMNKKVYDMDIHEKNKSSFEVKTNENDAYKVVSKVFIPKGSYILAESSASNYIIHQKSVDNLQETTKVKNTGKVSIIAGFLDYIENNGKESIMPGLNRTHVEIGWSSLITKTLNEKEVNVGRWMSQELVDNMSVFSPVFERYYQSYDVFLMSTRDIHEGEELKRLSS